MRPRWSYTTTTGKPTDGTSARLTLHATAAIAASPDVVLDASTLALRCGISVDGSILNPSTLVDSVSARYILDWLRLVSLESRGSFSVPLSTLTHSMLTSRRRAPLQHRKTLAVDHVEGPHSDADDLICALLPSSSLLPSVGRPFTVSMFDSHFIRIYSINAGAVLVASGKFRHDSHGRRHPRPVDRTPSRFRPAHLRSFRRSAES